MLHLGLGSFHRAHQAVYLQRLIERGDARWSLAGGNLRPDMAETMAALQRAGRRLHAGDGVAGRRVPLRAHRRRSARCCPTSRPGRADRARRRRRRRASSRSPSPRPATTSTPRTGSTWASPSSPPTSSARARGEAGQHDLRRAVRRSCARAAPRRRPGDAAQLRQPAPQRRALSRRAAASSSSWPATPTLLGLGARPTPPARTRWSTASRRARRPSCASACAPPPAGTMPRR